MHPHHHNGQFVVPRRDDRPDVGVIAPAYTEPLADEIREAAADRLARMVDRTMSLAVLVAFGEEVLRIVARRAASDVEDFPRPASAEQSSDVSKLTPAVKRRLVSAELGRILDLTCKGRSVLEMGVRVAALASHVRAAAIDHRTDQQLALEVGNDSRASFNKTKSEIRRALGADYAGENGKGSNTKARCKNSRLKNLKR